MLGIDWSGLAVGCSMMILILLPVVRLIMVYLLPLIYKCNNKTFPLSGKELKMCWYSGLVRGVIAFALCLQIETESKDFLTTIVLVIVMITTLIGASMLKTFSNCIGLKSQEDDLNLLEHYSSKYISVNHYLRSNLSKSLIEESDYKPIDFGLES